MLPQSYPNHKTVHRRFQTHEILRLVLTDVANELRENGALDEEECFIDATFVMAKGGGSETPSRVVAREMTPTARACLVNTAAGGVCIA